MTVLIVLVFTGVFAVMALLLLANGAEASQRAKQTLDHLETALATDAWVAKDQAIDIRKDELLSAVPVLHRWLVKLELAAQVKLWIYQANLKWTAGGLLLMEFGCFGTFGYLAYSQAGSLGFAVMAGLVASLAPVGWVVHKRKKRFEAFETELPEALELMVGALRAGHSLVAALRMVAHESPDPIGVEFRICFEEQNYGLELRTAMENLIRRVPLQDVRIVTTAILIQKESGGNLAEVLEKSATLIRERFKLKREIKTRTAQGRLTGWILSILPLVLGLLMYSIDPEMIRVLWTKRIGLELLYGAIAMTALGAVVIHRIVDMEV